MMIGVSFFLFALLLVIQWQYWKIALWKQNLQKALKERTEELVTKNRQLEHMEQQNLLMVEQSLKLQEMDRLKSRFFADISHEFRTPLTVIMGTLEQIRYQARDSEIESSIKRILRNSRQLLGLINQLLDLARFDSGKMKLKAAPQNLVPFIKGIVESFRFFALQNKLELTFRGEEEPIVLFYDAEKLEKVLINLLANALKFTPPGGKIKVTVTRCRRGKHIKISVADTGIGIPNEHLPYIFDRYYQVGGPDRRDQEQKGTGLGLALTKELVTLHHGIIDVHSTIGKGTEFAVKLPMGDSHLTEGEKAPTPPTPLDANQTGIKPPEPSAAIIPSWEPVNSEGTQPPLPGKVQKKQVKKEPPEKKEKDLVLVVEDSTEMREFLRKPFEQQFDVIEAANGREGMEKARGFNPDLVLSDIMMPEMDGYELCRGLKKDIHTSQIPVILLSAKATEESISKGLETRADDYVVKPFNTRLLALRMKNLIRTRRELKESMKQQALVQPADISVTSMEDEFLSEVREILEKNLSDPEFNVEELARKMLVSRSGLYKKIHALIGETPVEFIRNYRLERARQLLKRHFGNITEVSQEVGFANVAYFTKCYKKLFKRLPSELSSGKNR